MERALEASVRVEADPKLVVEILCSDPAGILTGLPSRDTGAFGAEIAVDLGGGASLAHEVDVVFGRLPNDGTGGRFSLSWHAPDHQGALPAFAGHLEVHPEGSGSHLQLSGHYSLPLGPVGGFGDRLLGHRIARRSIQTFLEAAGARIDGELAHRQRRTDGPPASPPTESVTITIDDVHTELYLG
jgi:hypothetical protein